MRSHAKEGVPPQARSGQVNALSPRSEIVRFALVVIVSAIVALGASAWYASRQARVSDPASHEQSARSTTDQVHDVPASPSKVRHPTISLATSAVPGTLESLQLEAEEVTKELLARFPEMPEALHVSALLRARLRQTEQAEKLWQRCVALAPHSEQYRVNLAAIAMDRGNNELAAEALQPVVATGSYSPDVTHHLAIALSNLGRNEEAEQLLVKAADRHSLSAAQLLVLGQARLKLGNLTGAETDLRQALELGSRSPELYFALANACARLGKNDEAAELRRQFADLKAKQPLSAQERYQVLSTADMRQTALVVMTEAAAVHARQKDSQEGERLLLRAIALDPGNVAACRSLATLYEDEGLLPEERVVYERLVQIEPLNVRNYGKLAQLAADLGEPAAAEAALKQAISVQPDLAPAYTTLAQFYLQEGKPSKARWYAQEALRRSESSQGYVLLAETCRLLGDEATAAAALLKGKEMEAKDLEARKATAPRPQPVHGPANP